MTPTDSPENFPDLEQAREELREGIESSREIVRQSRLLIELSESDGAARGQADGYGVAN